MKRSTAVSMEMVVVYAPVRECGKESQKDWSQSQTADCHGSHFVRGFELSILHGLPPFSLVSTYIPFLLLKINSDI